MKHIFHAVLLGFLSSLLLSGCAAAESDAVELFAVNVGKGDALLLRAGDYACLVDAGNPWSSGRVRSAMAVMGVERLDAVFLTHPDGDHAGGLDWLARSDIPVGAWYASGAFTEVKPKKHPIVKAADLRGQTPVWLNRGDSVPMGASGATLTVLAPFTTFTDKDDNNSLVMLLDSPAGRLLLTGDMELLQEAALLAKGDDLACDVLKVPNHGDDDTLSEAFARACAAKLAVISTSTAEKPETPDPGVLARLRAVGSDILVTQEAELGLWITLRGGEPTLERVDVPADAAGIDGVRVAALDAKDDRITLANDGPDADLTGCSLYSWRGNEVYCFPDGCLLPAGGTLTLGSRATDGDYDLLWDEKRVLNKDKDDGVTVFDRYGRIVRE